MRKTACKNSYRLKDHIKTGIEKIGCKYMDHMDLYVDGGWL